jgi:hypothetical protein
MKTPIEMLQSIIEMQRANLGDGIKTHIALMRLAKEADEVVKAHKDNE